MKNFHEKQNNNLNNKGFTIIELCVIIAVIGILASVIIASYSALVEKSRKSSAKETALMALDAALADQYDKMLSKGAFIEVNGYCFTYDGDGRELSDGEKGVFIKTKNLDSASDEDKNWYKFIYGDAAVYIQKGELKNCQGTPTGDTYIDIDGKKTTTKK